MRKGFLNLQLCLLTRIFFALIIAVTVFSGCSKSGEADNKSIEQSQSDASNVGLNEAASSPTPEPPPLVLTADSLKDNKPVELNKLQWKYQPGDDLNWADLQFDDSSWEGTIFSENKPLNAWNGIGWFRLRLRVDESLAGQPLSFAIMHSGASEIYVNGKFMHGFGQVSASADEELTYSPEFTPIGITFPQPGEHIIAIRYSNTREAGSNNFVPPFAPRLSFLNKTINDTLSRTATKNIISGIDFGICLGVGSLHLLLFILNTRRRYDLFYSLLLLTSAANVVIAYFSFQNAGNEWGFIIAIISIITLGIALVSFAAYLYTTLEKRIPRYLWFMTLFWLVSVGLFSISHFFRMEPGSPIFLVFGILILLLIVWVLITYLVVIIRAVLRRIDGSWIIGLVGLFFIGVIVIPAMLAFLVESDSNLVSISGTIGFVCLILTNTVFLARQSARTSKELESQLLKEVEDEKVKARLALVEAENERRAKELDEARQLQLSMLPKKLPQLPNLEIAAYMKPATEVGGDYYDFHIGNDGKLTIAVGDATGHGLKAGTIVTATKSLFNTLAHEPDITAIFKQSSAVLKNMNLRGLYMAMTIVKIKDNFLTVSSAGMPSTLIYRSTTGQVEEISIKAMPLGSVSNFAYQQQKFNLVNGDCVIIMSDGFPEVFNEAGEMLGYDKAQMILQENAHLTAQEIVNRFVKTAEHWAGNRPPDDDVTFVVVKII